MFDLQYTPQNATHAVIAAINHSRFIFTLVLIARGTGLRSPFRSKRTSAIDELQVDFPKTLFLIVPFYFAYECNCLEVRRIATNVKLNKYFLISKSGFIIGKRSPRKFLPENEKLKTVHVFTKWTIKILLAAPNIHSGTGFFLLSLKN